MTAPQDVPALLREAYAHAQSADAMGYRAMAHTIRTLAVLIQARRYIEQQWRPIETAPKDGTEVLLFWTKMFGDHSWQSVGKWNDDRYNKKPRPYWTCQSERLAGLTLPERLAGLTLLRKKPPTHWMPLPPAPGGSHE